MLRTYLLKRGEDLVLSEANCIVSLLYVTCHTHQGHDEYMFAAA